MSRVFSAVCLSASLAALGLSVVGLSRRGRDGPADRETSIELAALRAELTDFRERIETIELRKRPVAEGAAGATPTGEGATPATKSANLATEFARLAARLAELERPEAIAELAERGEQRRRTEGARKFLNALTDPQASPEERRERLEQHWKRHGSLWELIEGTGLEEDEVLAPLMALARDPGLELEARLEVLGELEETDNELLRQPLLDLLRSEEAPELRQQAVRNLVAQAQSVEAQEAILTASQNDPSEEVRGTAGRRLEAIHELAVEHTPGSRASQLTEADFPERDDEGEWVIEETVDEGEREEELEHRNE